MAVRAICGATEYEIWHSLPLALGLQYQALWWQQEDQIRQRSAFSRVARIFVSTPFDLEEGEGESEIVV